MRTTITLLFLVFVGLTYSQENKTNKIENLQTEIKFFLVDTSNVPDDELTKEIRDFRKVKGGFNINDIILLKISESKSKGDILEKDAEKMEALFKTGIGKQWLENAVIHIYRKQFTISEIKELTKFYSSSAGKKMSESLPLILMESMKAAETIMAKFKPEEK